MLQLGWSKTLYDIVSGQSRSIRRVTYRKMVLNPLIIEVLYTIYHRPSCKCDSILVCQRMGDQDAWFQRHGEAELGMLFKPVRRNSEITPFNFLVRQFWCDLICLAHRLGHCPRGTKHTFHESAHPGILRRTSTLTVLARSLNFTFPEIGQSVSCSSSILSWPQSKARFAPT